MLVYDVTSSRSFDNIKNWMANIQEVRIHFSLRADFFSSSLRLPRQLVSPFLSQHANTDVEKMLLGNKSDMADQRAISKQQGEQVRHEHNRHSGALLKQTC